MCILFIMRRIKLNLKQRIKKYLIASMAALFLLNGGCVSSAAAAEPSVMYLCETAQTARADNIGWVYKTVNGKLYRRLYNHTTKKYLTDWELVG